MENEKLVDDIKTIVEGIFSDKEQAGQMQKTQEALNDSATTIASLTQKLEDINTELASLQESATQDGEDKDSKISELTTELEAAQKRVGEVEAELASTTESLENIKKDQLAEARMVELKESKVVMTNNLVAQTAKVRALSDDEFASYKEERIELRQAVEKELEEALKAEAKAGEEADNTNNGGQKGAEGTAAGKEAAAVEEGVTTPPANIAPGQAIAAAMNFETKPSDDMLEKYADLGKEMASIVSGKSDK